ncbi:MAG: hypothetical protein H5U40_07950, partial [Polyangiaceae bacterium]|nr:hypothetical protein [Polyangiaceae bacterium]
MSWLALVCLVACNRDEPPRSNPSETQETPASTAQRTAPPDNTEPEPPPRDMVVQLAAQPHSVCARFESGLVRCFGEGGDGDHGMGLTQCATGVGRVRGLDDAIDVVAGEDHFCVRRAEGAVVCWGDHYYDYYPR